MYNISVCIIIMYYYVYVCISFVISTNFINYKSISVFQLLLNIND